MSGRWENSKRTMHYLFLPRKFDLVMIFLCVFEEERNEKERKEMEDAMLRVVDFGICIELIKSGMCLFFSCGYAHVPFGVFVLLSYLISSSYWIVSRCLVRYLNCWFGWEQ